MSGTVTGSSTLSGDRVPPGVLLLSLPGGATGGVLTTGDFGLVGSSGRICGTGSGSGCVGLAGSGCTGLTFGSTGLGGT